MGVVGKVRAARVVGQLLFALQQVLFVVVILSLGVSFTPNSGWAHPIGGIVAIVCFVDFAVTNYYLAFTENKLFFRNGFSQISFVLRYVRRTRRVLDFIFLILIVSAVLVFVGIVAAGMVNLFLTVDNGHYFLWQSGHGRKQEISVSEFVRLSAVSNFWAPGMISIVFTSSTSLALRASVLNRVSGA